MKRILFLSMLIAVPALANPGDEARAREFFKKGQIELQAARFGDAKASFSAGYSLSKKPGFLWNMAECERALGHRVEALELYRKYLGEASPTATERPEAEKRITELEPTKSASSPITPAPLAPVPSPASANAPLALQPVAPTSPGAPSFNPPPAPDQVSKPNVPDSAKPVTKQWWFWTGAAVVAGAVIGGVIAGTTSRSGNTQATPATYSADWK